jgi:hypothetical protein
MAIFFLPLHMSTCQVKKSVPKVVAIRSIVVYICISLLKYWMYDLSTNFFMHFCEFHFSIVLFEQNILARCDLVLCLYIAAIMKYRSVTILK